MMLGVYLDFQANQSMIPINIQHHPAVEGTHLFDTYLNNQKRQYLWGTKSHPPLASFVFVLSILWRLSLLRDEGQNQKMWEFDGDQWFVNVDSFNVSPRMQQSSFETKVLFDESNLK